MVIFDEIDHPSLLPNSFRTCKNTALLTACTTPFHTKFRVQVTCLLGLLVLSLRLRDKQRSTKLTSKLSFTAKLGSALLCTSLCQKLLSTSFQNNLSGKNMACYLEKNGKPHWSNLCGSDFRFYTCACTTNCTASRSHRGVNCYTNFNTPFRDDVRS